jgi:hypothetical protein
MKNRDLVVFTLITVVTVFVGLTGAWCFAEPTTEPAFLKWVRPYMEGNLVVVCLKETTLCDTDCYYIYLSDLGGKEAYAAALAALLGNKRVMLEISDREGCRYPGYGTRLQSVYILSD